MRLQILNEGFRTGGLPLRIERRGRRLGLRGRLPRRDGPGVRVQRLSLGLQADGTGLEAAVRQLHVICADLASGRFCWSQWLSSRHGPQRPHHHQQAGGHADGLTHALQRFQEAFASDPVRSRNPAGQRSTWAAAYWPYLRRLTMLSEQHPLSQALLVQTLESYQLASRSRQQCGTVLAALARQEGIPLPEDWSVRSGGYGLHRAGHRQLPTDQQIMAAWHRIPNPAWRWVLGVMATYGLRNHEVFFCDYSALHGGSVPVVRVLATSKTGERQAWPFLPEWVEHFALADVRRPPVTTDLEQVTLQQVGRRVMEQFRRYKVGFSPYDLRHAWAVRTIHLGLPDTVAARMMGHSVAIHTRTYHHWLTHRDQQQAVNTALARRHPVVSP
ncbi:MAG: site-specific integrase [Synechococcus sp. SB0662_bin_45]|uniref:Site-specific integrase n=1 Tax=Synechococcus sp. SB0676_bin_10 TaxID=2604869 RepID=A0A6B1FCC5_9SYNE|nr:site-specific integrase [Cyanobacteria bacterium MAG IRC3_bin_20]MCY3653911.1 site-specific integrase [Cyanobacteria bacterium MAG IRC1_bin_28]MDE0648658.1 site-specific integrase [Cyanobacteria bacterium MAG IRC4_bin_6]MXW13031.1 site-specific integrase [Synechococcus sp. SB0668_bin_13]MXX08580.1 site-specific integrase [Synechococcus sp. SB0667_bin_8]MXY18773.1 site-specific integrase [Synechococcus sp. SB0664_bin_36]MYE21972.1 site-specific integrase [Synechococcus sp. SB0662_bin_45]MY